MESHFSSDFFTGNRQKLRQLFQGKAPIVITAAGLLQRSGDTAFAFNQDASFWYLTGLDYPDLVLVMDKDREYLVVPDRDAVFEAFNGALDKTELSRRSGIAEIVGAAEGWRQLAARLKKVRHVATLAAPPAYLEGYGMYTNPARRRLIHSLKKHNPMLELLDLTDHLAKLRMVKQPEELAAIQTAIDVTAKGMKTALKQPKLGRYAWEYEVEAELTRAFRKNGAGGHAFDPIIAGGARACTIHHLSNDGRLAADELLVVDVGAEVEHYAADITRTVALGTPSRRQLAVHAAVAEVQDFAMNLIRPGTVLKDYEAQVEHFMGEKLRELGLIKTIEREQVRRYYPHATSHYLGLNVHDVGDRQGDVPVGAVLTVEPGIYIPEEGLGVRIEDDVLVIEDGIRVLSDQLPRVLS